MKQWLLLLCIFWLAAPSLSGQVHHNLRYSADDHSIIGHSSLSWEGSADTLWLHLPPRALSWKNSFLNQQLADFQNVKLFYATREEAGALSIEHLRVNGKETTACKACEFAAFGGAEGRNKIEIEYHILLPEASFNGVGHRNEIVRLIDWLPRIVAPDTALKRPYPISYHFDAYHRRDSFNVKLQVPQNWHALSNLEQRKQQNDSLWSFSGTARSLQIFIAPQLHYYPLGSGRQLVLTRADGFTHELVQLARRQVASYFADELNDSLQDYHTLLLLPQKKGDYQSANLLSLEEPNSVFELSRSLAEATAEGALRYRVHPNGYLDPWLARGLPYFYKYGFVESYYPKERWVPFSTTILGKLLALDDYAYGYQNRFLYLFLSRQGLDQPMATPVDSLSRLNYTAMVQGKAFLTLSHLRAYLGEREFKRGMARYYQRFRQKSPRPAQLHEALQFYSPKPLDWFFEQMLPGAALHDYQLKKVEHCATVTVATVHQRGHQALPYSLTGYKEGKPVLTQWFEGHRGQRSVQLYHEDYDKVVLNDHLNHFEYRQKNNTWYNRRFFSRAEPLRFQFYNSFENAESSQIFYLPSVSYNAYDLLLLGANFSNRSFLVQKPFEYGITPNYSTGTGRLTGGASVVRNITLPKSHFFRQISLGLFGRYFHYDRDLAFARLSPAVNLRIRKPYPRSPLIQNLRFRAVLVDRELAPNFDGSANRLDEASYSIFNTSYRLENTSIFKPTIFRANLELADDFGKLYAEWDQRWMLPNRRWLIWRNFAGVFLYNRFASEGINNNFYSFGLSGTLDYMFDYQFIGRSDQSGIWSQQMFITDGGFKSQTDAFADRFLVSSNLSVPIYSVFGVFGDVALSEQQIFYDYGIRISLLSDFLEFYFPLANQDRNFVGEAAYLQNVRFILDLDLNNIINRLRRGYY